MVTNPDTGRLLTPEEFAERIRQSRQSVYRHIANGQIEALQLGTGPKAPLRIRQGELERFLVSTTHELSEAG